MLAFAVPAGAVLVTLATLPGAASAAAHTASLTIPAKVSAVIPSTTKAMAAANIVLVKSIGSTKTITLAAPVSLKVGDIIAAGIGKATPDGLIAKVTRVSGVTLTATSATLRQAVPQGSFSATGIFNSVSSGALTKNLPCGTGGGSVPFEGNATVTVRPTLTASWTAKSSNVTISAAASGTAETAVNDLPAYYVCSPAPSPIGATVELAPIQVSVGSIPVVITPQLRWFVQGAVNTTQFITNEVSQTFSASASLNDNGGKYTIHGAASTSRTVDVTGTPTFAPSRNLASVTMGPQITMGLFGHPGPVLRVGLGSTLATSASALPWWTDDATQLTTGTVSTPDLALTSPTRILASHSTVAARGAAPKTGLSVYQTYGMQQGAVRGPRGDIWLIALSPPQWQGNPAGSQALDGVNSTTGSVNYYAPLPPYVGAKSNLLAYVNGAPAFDGSGNAWMIATLTTFSGARSYDLVRYTPGPSTTRIYRLPSSCPSPRDITSAGDGSVWLSCSSARAVRVVDSGAMRVFGLSRVASVGSLAAGPGGAMWAVAYNGSHAGIGLVRITAGGGESYYGNPRGIIARGVAGDGSGRIIETAACGASICFESVSSTGRLSHVATVPGRVGGNSAPTMDASGNVWLLVHGTAARTGQYFLKLTTGNRTQVYSFSLPACAGALLSIAGGTPGSADGSVWAESVTSCTSIGNTSTAYIGGLLRFKP